MINSLQREDFPDHGVSFVYLAHFYRKKIMRKKVRSLMKSLKIFLRISGMNMITQGILNPGGLKP
jgi:hypothetical protein